MPARRQRDQSLLLSLTEAGFLLIAASPSGAESATILYPPQSQRVVLYGQAALAVIARGTRPLCYQWFKDGLAVPGATNDQWVIAQAQFADGGAYSVIVTNAEGSATSTNVLLTVSSPVGGDVDGSFVHGGMIDYAVSCIVAQPDGKILIGGGFGTAHGGVRSGIARLNPDGSTDHSFMEGLSGADWTVNAIVLQADGKVLLGGDFSSVNGVDHSGMARLNPDGTLDTGFLNGLPGTGGAYPWVSAVALQGDGKVFIGGDFSSVNGVARYYLARLNADGTLDTSFLNGISGPNSTVESITVLEDGKILIAGYFSSVGGVSRNCIARLNPDGSVDTSFQNIVIEAQYSPSIHCVAVQSDGMVVIGGIFTRINGAPRNRIARLDSNGGLDTGFQDGLPGVDGDLYCVQVQSDGKVLLGGYFTSVNGVSRNGIARLHPDGTLDSAFQNGLPGVGGSPPYSSYYPYVSAVLSCGDGKVLLGGNFGMVNGELRNRVAKLHADGTLDSFQNGAAGADYMVTSIAVQRDAKVLLGGSFLNVSNGKRQGIARLLANGALDATFQDGMAGVVGQVHAIVQQPDDKLLIGGGFNSVNGLNRTNLARLQPDGALDGGFLNGVSGPDSSVESLAVQSDGKVLLGGYFTSVNGLGRNRVARLNSDGTLDTGFLNGLAGANAVVNAVLLQSDGQVVVAGEFTTINGVSRNRIARLNSDGTLDTSFQNGLSGASASISAAALQSDGKIVVGGYFTSINSVTRTRIARLNANGSLDTAFQNGASGVNGPVYSVAVASDGKVVLGGSFEVVNGASRESVARLNVNGTLDTGFQNGLGGTYGYVAKVAVQPDGKVLVAGDFERFNGLPVAGLVRLWGSSSIPPLFKNLSPSGGSVTLTWYSLSNRSYRVQYRSSLSATNWTNLAGDILATASTASKTDTTFTEAAQRFYRVVLLP